MHYGFSLETGNFLWQTAPEPYINAWDDSLNVARMIANGKFYSTSISGVVNCYDVKDGTTLWTYEAKDPYGEVAIQHQLVATPIVPHQRLRILWTP